MSPARGHHKRWMSEFVYVHSAIRVRDVRKYSPYCHRYRALGVITDADVNTVVRNVLIRTQWGETGAPNDVPDVASGVSVRRDGTIRARARETFTISRPRQRDNRA